MEGKDGYSKLKYFFTNFGSVRADNIGFLLLAVLFEFFHGAAMMVPYQEVLYDRAVFLVPMATGAFGPALYLLPYFLVMEDGKGISITEKLKYLPVDVRDIRRLRIEKLAAFVCRLFPVFFCLQLLFSGLYFKEICIGNILYALFFGLVWPFLSNLWLIVWPMRLS